jgi:hypothetical protein
LQLYNFILLYLKVILLLIGKNMKKELLILLMSVTFLFAFSACSDDANDNSKANLCEEKLSAPVQCEAMTNLCDERLEESIQCEGITKSTGERCKSKTYNACGYCSSHTLQYEGEAYRCYVQTTNACGYCDKHSYQYVEE